MKILLDLHGWQKTMEADDWMIHKGYVEVALDPPMHCLCPPKDYGDIPTKSSITFARFFYTGRVTSKTRLRIFKYDDRQ